MYFTLLIYIIYYTKPFIYNLLAQNNSFHHIFIKRHGKSVLIVKFFCLKTPYIVNYF